MSNNGSRETPKQTTHLELQDEAAIERLIKAAGPRVNPPQSMAAEVRRRVYADWKAETQRSALSPQWLALAATLVLGVVFGVWRITGEDQVLIAEVDRVSGSVEYSLDNISWQPAEQLAMQEPAYLRTDDQSLASLTLHNNINVRMDLNTSIRLTSASELILYQGGVYVDSGVTPTAQRQISITTPFGRAEDIGTQFEVRLDEQSMHVKVREGTVILHRDTDAYRRDAGQTIKVHSDGSTFEGAVPVFGDQWAWTQAIAPTFEIDQRKLIEFLRWVARETGSKLRFKSAFCEAAAEQIELHGSISGFTPAESLTAVLATTEVQQIPQTDGIILLECK
jgi:ferric-dicitrate binding protein FerR (iron transport regulator)